MREDECRRRLDEASENLAGARHIAFNFLNIEQAFKAGIQRKQKLTGRNKAYLSQALMGQGAS